jgi:hypothetical protein
MEDHGAGSVAFFAIDGEGSVDGHSGISVRNKTRFVVTNV